VDSKAECDQLNLAHEIKINIRKCTEKEEGRDKRRVVGKGEEAKGPAWGCCSKVLRGIDRRPLMPLIFKHEQRFVAPHCPLSVLVRSHEYFYAARCSVFALVVTCKTLRTIDHRSQKTTVLYRSTTNRGSASCLFECCFPHR